ncbi:MAG: magnesium transporter MgtE N-terminal domain-containing protein [Ignavibacteriaceae bacterium]
MSETRNHTFKINELPSGMKEFNFIYFSQLLKLPVCTGKIKDKIGKVFDIVFRITEPFPEAAGIYIEHGWGKPNEFVPWDKVIKIEDDAIFVYPGPKEGHYPPFVDQAGWILINDHLMGRTILDMDGRRIEVVNDAHLLESKGKLYIVHVDISFNGFLRKWGLKNVKITKERLIPWKYVQPLSLEDAGLKDVVSLSLTRNQIKELPSQDLADILEELSGEEQVALFSVLDSEKAAETLLEAEPRAQRQLIASLRKERAQTVMSELSIPQLADLFSILPHEDVNKLMPLLSEEQSKKIKSILSERESTAKALMSSKYLAVPKQTKVNEVFAQLKKSDYDPGNISYIYVVNEEDKVLLGVVDLREMAIADENSELGDIMTSPVVSAEEDDYRDDLVELFTKYHYRLLPVVNRQDHILGVISYNDIMKGLVTRVKI